MLNLGFKSKEPYVEMEDGEDLPLGSEFQELVTCFLDQSASSIDQKYNRAAYLIKQLE